LHGFGSAKPGGKLNTRSRNQPTVSGNATLLSIAGLTKAPEITEANVRVARR
jgi:hypothetical protein